MPLTIKDHALIEMVIAENGPLMHYAQTFLKYWEELTTSGKWHFTFIRNTEDISSYTDDAIKVVGNLMDQKSKLPCVQTLVLLSNAIVLLFQT